MKKLYAILIIAVMFAIVTGAVVYGLSVWNHRISGEVVEEEQFTVYSDVGLTTEWASGVAGNSTAGGATDFAETYYIKNDGNVPITIQAVGSFSSGSGVDVWNPVSKQVSIPVGSSSSMTVSLSDIAVGIWSYDVAFSIVG